MESERKIYLPYHEYLDCLEFGENFFRIRKDTALDENINVEKSSSDCLLCLISTFVDRPASVPRMLGLEKQEVHQHQHQSNEGWSPVYVEDNLALRSCRYFDRVG